MPPIRGGMLPSTHAATSADTDRHRAQFEYWNRILTPGSAQLVEAVVLEAKAKLKFHFAETLEDVLRLALVPEPRSSVEIPAQLAVVS